MRRTSTSRKFSFPWVVQRAFSIFIWISCLAAVQSALAKQTSGEFRLSGLNTEYVLGSFAVSAGSKGNMKVTFTAEQPYQLNQDVAVRIYRDDKWDDYQKAPSCTDKVPLSRINIPVRLERQGTNEYSTVIERALDNTKPKRIHYFYFVITDCSLEFYMHDDQVPVIKYQLEATDNDGSHVAADESHLKSLHTVTFMISGILAVGLLFTIIMALHDKSTVHAAMFLVMVAAACDSWSSFFEIVHLTSYSKNGVGSYSLDCLSAHFEALCDSMVALLLLSIASGWTLPSDVIAVQHNTNMVQKLLGGFQSPFRAIKSCSPSAIFAFAIIIFHVFLAQWGRTYNDDFDSYHDLAHLPGKVLMIFRIILGLCLLICCFQTKSRCPPSLHAFYVKLALVGSMWFQSLPMLTWYVNTFVKYHNRHYTIGMGGATLQTSAIVLLTWLVTSHSKTSSYHKLSHLATESDNLTDSLTAASSIDSAEETRTWKMGKAKVRLD